MKHSATLLAILIIVGVAISPAYADLNNLDIGGKIKAMGVYTDNTEDLNNDGNDQDAFARTELHLWMQAMLAENVTARVSLESDRAWSSSDAALDESGRPDSDQLDIFLEEAYIKLADLYGMPMTITIGRQFIEMGDGFVFGDAIPFSPYNIRVLGEAEQDPFDAIKIDYELSEDWLVTFIWAKVLETRTDMEDIDHFMLNLMFLGLEDHVIEGYWLLTYIDGPTSIPGGFPPPGVVLPFERAKIHNLGVRAEGRLVDTLAYHAEAVFQLADELEGANVPGPGGFGDQDISAFALEGGLRLEPGSMEENEVAFGATITYLSGDDNPGDSDYDAFIQVAENRTFGEIADYFQGLVSNNIVDPYFAGVFIFNLDAEAALSDRLKGALELYYFLSDEDVVLRSGGQPYSSGGDSDIGFELDGFLNYEITEDLSAQLASGFFVPGSAGEDWAGGSDDTAWFIRGGVSVNF